MRVLLVKMSSLGDVVHALPGVSDAARARGVVFDWVVEEAFAAIPARHPAVADVIPIAWRRWRRDLAGNRGELGSFVARLRQRRYDLVLDAQGLIKSAAVTALARGLKAGLSRQSAREGAASFAYRQQIVVPRQRHAIDRIRLLFAEALGYPPPAGVPEYRIAAADARREDEPRRCFLLHGTTWPSKLWPVRFWRELAGRAAADGFDVVVPWADETERRRAREITDGTRATVLERMPLAALIEALAGASLAVGVDSGLSHLAAALEVPTVAIYGSTDSALTGLRGARVRNLQADFPCSPCFSRICTYRGPEQRRQGTLVEPACYASLPPERVWQAAGDLLGRSGDADRILHL